MEKRKSSAKIISSRKALEKTECALIDSEATSSTERRRRATAGTNNNNTFMTLDSFLVTPKDEDRSLQDVPKRRRGVSLKEFSSSALHRRFEEHVRKAQDAFLSGETALAETHASKALAIRPTAHLFAFMAVLAESKGQFDRASDFRLLQAFLAKDRVLWEELLHEFLSQQLYFKSAMVLQRLAALEKRDRSRYRALQLQLADLYIGLGEIRRAVNVLVPLWESSRYQDFGVFSTLAGLYFQLGKWNALENLISSSLRYFLSVDKGGDTATEGENGNVEDGENASGASLSLLDEEEKAIQGKLSSVGSPSVDHSSFPAIPEGEAQPLSSSSKPSKARRRRIRFLDNEEEAAEEREPIDATETGAFSRGWEVKDEAPFDPLFTAKNYYSISPSLSSVLGMKAWSDTGGRPALSKRNLNTPKKRQSFLVLINVHSEFLNEQSKFTETIQLVDFAAACLGDPLLSLPPDLLFRYGTACAFQGKGSVYETPCTQVFQHLLQTCRMDDYGDVLLDAAANLCKAGMLELSEQIYEVFVRYYTLEQQEKEKQLNIKKKELENAQAIGAVQATPRLLPSFSNGNEEEEGRKTVSSSRRTFVSLLEEVHEMEKECKDLQLILAESFYGLAQCRGAREDFFDDDEPASFAKRALEVYPGHLQARLLLGKHYFYNKENLLAAVEVLTPQPEEPALQRIQLGARLVAIFRASKKYLEAVALGVSIFNLILSTPDDGDTESVAPGSYAASSRRSLTLRLPTLSRASSAIVPASSLYSMVHGAGPSSAALSSRVGGVSLLSQSLASSIRSGSSVFRQQLSRRGHSALTTTVYGASAAQSLAAGWDPKMEEEKLKDSSTIFQFHRKRSRSEQKTRKKEDSHTKEEKNDREKGPVKKEDGGKADPLHDLSPLSNEPAEHQEEGKDGEEEEEPFQERCRRRREEVERLSPSAFWMDAAAGALEGGTTTREKENEEKNKDNLDDKEEEKEGSIQGENDAREIKRKGRAETSLKLSNEKKGLISTISTTGDENGMKENISLMEWATTTTAAAVAAPDEAEKAHVKSEKSEKQENRKQEQNTGDPVKGRKEEHHQCLQQSGGHAENDAKNIGKEGPPSSRLEADLDDVFGEIEGMEDIGEKVDDALPSLEELSQQFEDKEMAQLFLATTMGTWEGMRHQGTERRNEPYTAAQMRREGDGGGSGNISRQMEEGWKETDASPFSASASGKISSVAMQSLEFQAHLQKLEAEKAAQQQAVSSVSAKEVVQVLGRHECMELARNIMECYRALGRFSEAKEFAALVLARFSGKRQSPHHRHSLERPLRLALLRASLAAGEAEDAVRVGLRLLQDDTSQEEQEEVLQLLHGVLNRTEDRSQVLFRHILEGNHCPSVLLLLANRYIQTRSYCRALNLYLVVYSKYPNDVLVVFMIGLLYFLCSHQKHMKHSEECITAGIYFFSLYQDRVITLLGPHQRSRYGEVLYNTARILQMIQQPSLCVPLYERVGYQLRVPEECTLAVQRAARFNLYFLYRWRSDNAILAVQSLMKQPCSHSMASSIHE